MQVELNWNFGAGLDVLTFFKDKIKTSASQVINDFYRARIMRLNLVNKNENDIEIVQQKSIKTKLSSPLIGLQSHDPNAPIVLWGDIFIRFIR